MSHVAPTRDNVADSSANAPHPADILRDHAVADAAMHAVARHLDQDRPVPLDAVVALGNGRLEAAWRRTGDPVVLFNLLDHDAAVAGVRAMLAAFALAVPALRAALEAPLAPWLGGAPDDETCELTCWATAMPLGGWCTDTERWPAASALRSARYRVYLARRALHELPTDPFRRRASRGSLFERVVLSLAGASGLVAPQGQRHAVRDAAERTLLDVFRAHVGPPSLARLIGR